MQDRCARSIPALANVYVCMYIFHVNELAMLRCTWNSYTVCIRE